MAGGKNVIYVKWQYQARKMDVNNSTRIFFENISEYNETSE